MCTAISVLLKAFEVELLDGDDLAQVIEQYVRSYDGVLTSQYERDLHGVVMGIFRQNIAKKRNQKRTQVVVKPVKPLTKGSDYKTHVVKRLQLRKEKRRSQEKKKKSGMLKSQIRECLSNMVAKWCDKQILKRIAEFKRQSEIDALKVLSTSDVVDVSVDVLTVSDVFVSSVVVDESADDIPVQGIEVPPILTVDGDPIYHLVKVYDVFDGVNSYGCHAITQFHERMGETFELKYAWTESDHGLFIDTGVESVDEVYVRCVEPTCVSRERRFALIGGVQRIFLSTSEYCGCVNPDLLAWARTGPDDDEIDVRMVDTWFLDPDI